MLEMVEARKNADKVEQRHDLFSGLLDEAVLNNEELTGEYGYSTSRPFGILRKRLTPPPREHVYSSFCWT